MSEIALEFKNVFKHFTDNKSSAQQVLENSDFCLEKNKIAVLIGPSGIGKTTVLQIAGLLCAPSSGSVYIDGVLCKDDKSATEIRRDKIGFVYQFHHLLPEFSVLKNVMMPLLMRGADKYIAKQEAQNLLKTLGLIDIQNSYVHEISGGQKQRAAVARAIIHKPKLIIADEPTGNLDEENAKNVLHALINLSKECGSAILLATHNHSFVSESDYVVKIINRTLHKM